jgi:NAD(P)-dependent dehydrogenase (short-subunit alcohol dehydrogenase family)
VYNAALPDPGEILDTTVERLRTAYDVDVLGAVVAAQVATPILRAAGGGTLLATSGGFADNPVPALASLSIGKAALRSAQTLIAAGVRDDGIHAATVTIAGAVKPGTDFDPDKIAEIFWTAHTDAKDAWKTEYRFTGAQAGPALGVGLPHTSRNALVRVLCRPSEADISRAYLRLE